MTQTIYLSQGGTFNVAGGIQPLGQSFASLVGDWSLVVLGQCGDSWAIITQICLCTNQHGRRRRTVMTNFRDPL